MDSNKISNQNGLIYLMEHSEAFKVGFTQNAQKRLKHTQTHLPQKLALVLTVPGTFEAEQDFHKLFKHESLGNEWYPISFKPTAVAYLQSLAVEMHPEPHRTADPGKTKRRKQVHPKSLANLKTGRSKYGCKTQSIRVPQVLIPEIRALVDEFVAAKSLCTGDFIPAFKFVAVPVDIVPRIKAFIDEYGKQNPIAPQILSDKVDTPPG